MHTTTRPLYPKRRHPLTITPHKSHAQAESTNDSWTLSAEGNLELLATDRSAEAGTEKLGPGHMAIVVNSGL